MNIINVVEARKRFSALVAKVVYTHQRTVIEQNGKPMAAIISIEDLRRLEALDRRNSQAIPVQQLAFARVSAAPEHLRA